MPTLEQMRDAWLEAAAFERAALTKINQGIHDITAEERKLAKTLHTDAALEYEFRAQAAAKESNAIFEAEAKELLTA